MNSAVDKIGAVDILINCAGVTGRNIPLWKISDADWNRIVNVVSIAGKEGNPNLSAYSASKAAVIALTKSLGKELATTGVLVNAVASAVIDTPMNINTTEETIKYMISKIPMGRVGEADGVAALIQWLSSDECSFSTGSVFDISGGRATY